MNFSLMLCARPTSTSPSLPRFNRECYWKNKKREDAPIIPGASSSSRRTLRPLVRLMRGDLPVSVFRQRYRCWLVPRLVPRLVRQPVAVRQPARPSLVPFSLPQQVLFLFLSLFSHLFAISFSTFWMFSGGIRPMSITSAFISRRSSLNWVAQTFSNRRRPAVLLLGNDAAISSISPCENHSRVFFDNSLNAARASSVRSTASDVTSFPFSSFTMKTISITRMMPFFSSLNSSGAVLPLNLFQWQGRP